MKGISKRYLLAAGCAVCVGLGVFGVVQESAAHKDPHDAATLKAFQDLFMEQVILGDRLFHGDPEAQKMMGVNLSKTGMACAMCHPISSDIHPHEFPKFQEQMSEFATCATWSTGASRSPTRGRSSM